VKESSLLLLAHLAKGNVSFCHHLASVVCRPLTFHILIFSSETPEPNEQGDNGKSYLSFNSLAKIYLSFNRGEVF
jgi:hypothetical protein